jgi:hypothetical protein
MATQEMKKLLCRECKQQFPRQVDGSGWDGEDEDRWVNRGLVFCPYDGGVCLTIEQVPPSFCLCMEQFVLDQRL